jgi:hypothetical protein
MPNIQLSDAEGFRAWAYMLVNNQDAYEVSEVNGQVNLFNSDDSAYLVIYIFTSETTSTHYTFISENEADKPKSIILVFDFLRSVDFSLTKLLQWLTDAPWVDSEMGDLVLTHGLAIYRDFTQATENPPNQ